MSTFVGSDCSIKGEFRSATVIFPALRTFVQILNHHGGLPIFYNPSLNHR